MCTSKQGFKYVGISVHWIDDEREIHSLPLGIYLHEGTSKAQNILDKFLSDIKLKFVANIVKVFSITTDTEPTMNAFGVLLESQGIHHLHCNDHLLFQEELVTPTGLFWVK